MIWADVLTVVSLVFLEGVLSLDNALVLAITVKHLPDEEQKKALRYGMWGAFLFRALSLLFLTYLVKIKWIKILGALYLLWMSIKYVIQKPDEDNTENKLMSFWKTVLTVELLDIAFSIDSIFAAVAMSSKWGIIFIGGVFGIIMMRFASYFFIELIKKHKWLEHIAYLLIFIIGIKLIVEVVI